MLGSVVACGGAAAPQQSATGSPSVPTGSPAAPTRSTDARATPSPIDAGPTAAAVTLRELALTFDGDARRVRVYVPEPTPTRDVPLVIVLHAAGETPTSAIQDTRFDELAGREGFIVAFPPADGRAWEAQVVPQLPDSPVDERYLSALIDRLIEDLPVDASRVYVAGFSMGAVMAERMACRHADQIAAAAVVSGTPWVGGACRPSRPVSMLVMHGTVDSTFPFDLAKTLADDWRALDGCTTTAAARSIGDGATAVTSSDCSADTSVEFISVEGGWHTWFAAPDATAISWRFFTDHGRP